MVEITTLKKHEILFLKSHPKGPKMNSKDIADYLWINEYIVSEICSEAGPNYAIKIDLSSSGSFEPSNSFYVGDKDKMINKLINKIAKLEEEINMVLFRKEKWNRICQPDFYGYFEKTLTISKNVASAIFLPSNERAAIKNDLSSTENAGMVLVKKEHWIHLCHIDFYEQLEKQLDINKSSAKDLCEPLNELYSIERFTASVHEDLLASIEYQKRLMDRMKRTFFGSFCYNAETSIQTLLMKINDLLKRSVPSESRSSPWCL